MKSLIMSRLNYSAISAIWLSWQLACSYSQLLPLKLKEQYRTNTNFIRVLFFFLTGEHCQLCFNLKKSISFTREVYKCLILKNKRDFGPSSHQVNPTKKLQPIILVCIDFRKLTMTITSGFIWKCLNCRVTLERWASEEYTIRCKEILCFAA